MKSPSTNLPMSIPSHLLRRRIIRPPDTGRDTACLWRRQVSSQSHRRLTLLCTRHISPLMGRSRPAWHRFQQMQPWLCRDIFPIRLTPPRPQVIQRRPSLRPPHSRLHLSQQAHSCRRVYSSNPKPCMVPKRGTALLPHLRQLPLPRN